MSDSACLADALPRLASHRFLFPPTDTDDDRTLTLVAGLPRVYETLCGPRDQKKVSGVLKTLGWNHLNVVKL